MTVYITTMSVFGCTYRANVIVIRGVLLFLKVLTIDGRNTLSISLVQDKFLIMVQILTLKGVFVIFKQFS